MLVCALALMIAVVFGGIAVAKTLDQAAHDKRRQTYRLGFPRELNEESITAWIRAISGTMRFTPTRLNGGPSVAFELWATEAGITHRLRVPWQHADFVISQLRSLVPGIHVTLEDHHTTETWTKAVEVGLTNSSRTLRIYSAADVAASLLASVQALRQGEVLMMQWVVAPAVPTQLPIYRQTRSNHVSPRTILVDGSASRDEVKDRREKLSEPNVLAVLRLASKADSPKRADHLIYRVRASLAAVRSPSSRFKKRWVGMAALQERVDRATSSMVFPIQLSAPEIAALIAWPVGNPFVSGLPPAMAKQLPASELVPREGRVIGRSTFPGNERKVAISWESSLVHTQVCGPTGVGKTTLLANMLKQDVDAGYGVVLIERKGDLLKAALDYIPARRIEDVIVVDVADDMRPVGFNILNQGKPRTVIDEIQALFQYLYKDTRGVWEQKVLYHGLWTITETPGLTLIDLPALLVPIGPEEARWRDMVVRNLKVKELRQFWQSFDNQPRSAQDRIAAPVMDRIWQLTNRPELKNIIGQGASSFQMRDVISENKILLVNLGGLPSDTAGLAGSLLVGALWREIQSTPWERPTFLYLDEFQSYLNLPIDPEDMLAKARSFGLGMVLAHQHLGQLPVDLRQAVLANARNKIVFQTSSDDARTFTREFGDLVDEQDFQSLGKYEAMARIATGDGVSPPLTIRTSEPMKGYGKTNAVRYVSRQKYGRDVRDVEREIELRRLPESQPKPKKPPRLSGSWGDGV